MSEENPNPSQSTSGTDPKVVGLVSYLTIIGWIVALILNSNNKSEFGSFHIRQSLGIILTGFVLGFVNVIPILGQIVWIVGIILLIILWFIGFIAAIQGEKKVVPVLGQYYQDWFKSL